METTANLQHPNILPLFDSGRVEGTVFYVMPYVAGESLRTRLRREVQLPVEDAVRIAAQVAQALDYAHRNGVIHRDIKPDNVLFHDGRALVADFGIALGGVSADPDARITKAGTSLGTPQYMSPEQAGADEMVDFRTDIYALGTVLYEMLAGEPPFTGPTPQAILARVMTEEPRPLALQRRTVPPHLDAAVARALEKLPADRWQSAAQFGEALTAGGGTLAQPYRRVWIAFAAQSKLRKVPVEGGPAIDLGPAEWAGGNWGRNGKIVYSLSYNTGLWIVSEGGGDARELTTADTAKGELGHWWPQILPDGDHVLFTTYRTPIERATIEMLSISTGARKVLVTGGVYGLYVATGHLLYGVGETIRAVPFDLKHLAVTGAAVPVVDSVAMNPSDGAAAFDVSDNGTLAYLPVGSYVRRARPGAGGSARTGEPGIAGDRPLSASQALPRRQPDRGGHPLGQLAGRSVGLSAGAAERDAAYVGERAGLGRGVDARWARADLHQRTALLRSLPPRGRREPSGRATAHRRERPLHRHGVAGRQSDRVRAQCHRRLAALDCSPRGRAETYPLSRQRIQPLAPHAVARRPLDGVRLGRVGPG
ncbi:MAG TPA: serine/threonine-protein kinase [Gemmatimonadales bacterium]|nr:serine/threonine-protein kinase [Gemmatimonadales bacterium]